MNPQPERQSHGRERLVMSTLIILVLVLWGGFAVHRAPRFAGSLTGGILGVSGAVLMVVFSLAYSAVKRIPALKEIVGRRVSLGKLLEWHVYTGALGAIFAVLHSGHRFESNLGMALTATVLLAALSGYVGRYLLGRVATDLRDKQAQLARLETAYNEAVAEAARSVEPLVPAEASPSVWSSLRFRVLRVANRASGSPADRAARMAESIADLEYSVRSHERMKRLSSLWLRVHIATALAFYVLLGLHVWAGIHFGLRWFE